MEIIYTKKYNTILKLTQVMDLTHKTITEPVNLN